MKWWEKEEYKRVFGVIVDMIVDEHQCAYEQTNNTKMTKEQRAELVTVAFETLYQFCEQGVFKEEAVKVKAKEVAAKEQADYKHNNACKPPKMG